MSNKMIVFFALCVGSSLCAMEEQEQALLLAPIAIFRQRLAEHKFGHIVRKTHIDQVLSECKKTPSEVVNTVEAFVSYYNACVQEPNLKEKRVDLLVEIVLYDHPNVIDQLKK